MSAQAVNLFDNYLPIWAHPIVKEEGILAQVSEEEIQEMYALAYVLYQKQHYEESTHFFRLLVVARPTDIKFWKGLGACLQMQKDYEGALQCYQCCVQDQPDPYLYVQTADCYFALKKVEDGLKALETARVNAQKTHDKRVLQHVTFMQQQWSKKSS